MNARPAAFVSFAAPRDHAAAAAQRAAVESLHPGVAYVGITRADLTGAAALDAALAAVDDDTFASVLVPDRLLAALDGGATAVFVAPRVAVIGSLDELIERGSGNGVVLLARPATLPDDGRRPATFDLRHTERVASALFGCGPAGRDALVAWREQAAAAVAAGLPVRFAAFVDAVADHPTATTIIRSPVFFADRYSATVDDRVAAVDLSRWSPDQPHRVDAGAPGPDRWYVTDIAALAARSGPLVPAPVAPPELADPDATMRFAYRSALDDPRERRDVPHPYRDQARFLEWLEGSDFPPPVEINRYLRALYLQRPDLSLAFPEVPGRDQAAFDEWCHTYGAREVPIPPRFLPPRVGAARARPDVTPRATGVNIIGFLSRSLGVGEYARRTAAACAAAGIPHTTVAFDPATGAVGDTAAAVYDVNVICINPDALAGFLRAAPPALLSGRYNIGIWAWETAELPAAFGWACEVVDEVWYASEFGTAAVARRAAGRVPVMQVPVPITVPERDTTFDIASFAPAAAFRAITVLDYDSVVARKNPLGAIRSFCAAFEPGSGAQLIVKSVNADRHLDDAALVRSAARGRDDVVFADAELTAPALASLVDQCDVFVSLHRSEGFGFNLADALALGKQVVATAYSGCLEYLDEHNSWLVPYQLTTVGPGQHPYPSDAQWAAPDEASAAGFLREIFAGARRDARVPPGFTPADVGAKLGARLAAIAKGEPRETSGKRRWLRR